MKSCTKCGQAKPLDLYYRSRKSKDGRATYCKACSDEIREARRKGELRSFQKDAWNFFHHCSDCDLWKVSSKDFYLTKEKPHSGHCKACVKKRANRYHHKHKKRINAKERDNRQELRKEMIDAYGSKCVCCGESQWEFLTIDHINGGGNKHRRKLGGSKAVFKQLKKLGWPKDKYQMLCFNCNASKGMFGYCPHQSGDWVLPESVAKEQTEKYCSMCKKTKPLSLFYKSITYSTYCKTCEQSRRRERLRLKKQGLILPDEKTGWQFFKQCSRCRLWKIRRVDFYSLGTDRARSACKKCEEKRRVRNLSKINEAVRIAGYKARLAVIDGYGGKCQCCGESHKTFLTVDHKNNDGDQKRAKGERTGQRLYKKLIKQNFPKEDYQLLCWNCNWTKGVLGCCPHES